jgi:hypothetical protein
VNWFEDGRKATGDGVAEGWSAYERMMVEGARR